MPLQVRWEGSLMCWDPLGALSDGTGKRWKVPTNPRNHDPGSCTCRVRSSHLTRVTWLPTCFQVLSCAIEAQPMRQSYLPGSKTGPHTSSYAIGAVVDSTQKRGNAYTDGHCLAKSTRPILLPLGLPLGGTHAQDLERVSAKVGVDCVTRKRKN